MLLQTFETAFTDSFCEKPYFIDPEIDLNILREGNIFLTGRLFADFTVEMKMPVFVCTFVATIVTKFILCGCIFLNTVNYTFFFKGF